MSNDLFEVDLSEVDTKEEIEEVLDDLAEIESNLETSEDELVDTNPEITEYLENESGDELVIPSELRSEVDRGMFYKNHAKKNGLHYLGLGGDGKPMFKEIEGSL